MAKYRFGDLVKEVKNKIDRDNNPYEYYVAGDHMDSEDLRIHRKGCFATDDVGPAFIREFKKGQILYGSRRTYLKKVAVADFDGVTANTTFVLETKNNNVFLQELLPFVMLSESFTRWSVSKSKGSTNPYILFSDLADYEFELPSISKQRELADLLWAAYELKESYERFLRASDEMAKSRFIEMFGTPKDHPKAVNLEAGFTIRDDLRKPINDATRSSMRSGTLYPYYGANGQVDSINKYLMDCEAICLAEDCGGYGAGEQTSFIVRGKCWVNNHAHVLIPKPNCDIEFANAFFRILDMTEYVTGTTRLKLTQASLKKIPIFLPPLERQEAFATLALQLDKSKVELQACISALEATMRLLSQRIFIE